ncbi:MAG: nucleotidyltransferase domain-containing protein [Nanoarchaeota archaeon]|nr:nucleotidyltransferase domain-containing protein [Nanoarchaeota archaeon]
MKFKIEKKERQAELHFPEKEFNIAREFTKKVYQEFGTFIKALVLFGSTVKGKLASEGDIDLLIIIDDVSVNLTRDLTQTYRIIIEKILADMPDSERLHIQSMKFTSWWEYIRAGDPVAINVLRYGVALIDTGVFDPLQALLDNGRIRPTKESIHTYFVMAPASLHKAKDHLLSAMVDLYWASIDAAHAALMSLGEIPPSPEHVADMLEKKMVKKGILKKRYADIMRRNYITFKKIIHRDIKEVDGADYDRYKRDTMMLVNEIKKFLDKKMRTYQ